ncbi:rRNA adenine N-6-methyltransferase family protein [Rhizocola hellebori]|nr:rRNA adenine N-6-methyltransferase family protein [Rhizocola hellebori]
MIDSLLARGHLPDAWRPVWQRVPRHLFVPDTLWVNELPLSRQGDPDGWAEAAYADLPLITLYDDGATPVSGPVGNSPAGCLSAPSVVAGILDAARVETASHILEIGAGSGWTPALLAAYAPGNTVISIEVDPVLANKARDTLAAAGFGPSSGVSVVAADGRFGYQLAAPFERVIATCAVYRVPQAWIEQTEVGGLVVTPWRTAMLDGLLLVLESHGNGSASGGFVDSASFTALCGQRRSTQQGPIRGGETRQTVLYSGKVFDDHGAHLAVALLVPDVDRWTEQLPHGHVIRLDAPGTGSWAWAQFPDGDDGPYQVRQGGPRRLWDEVEVAYQWWRSRDCPEYARFGVTVSRYGQSVWLDDPTNIVHQIMLSRN